MNFGGHPAAEIQDGRFSDLIIGDDENTIAAGRATARAAKMVAVETDAQIATYIRNPVGRGFEPRSTKSGIDAKSADNA